MVSLVLEGNQQSTEAQAPTGEIFKISSEAIGYIKNYDSLRGFLHGLASSHRQLEYMKNGVHLQYGTKAEIDQLAPEAITGLNIENSVEIAPNDVASSIFMAVNTGNYQALSVNYGQAFADRISELNKEGHIPKNANLSSLFGLEDANIDDEANPDYVMGLASGVVYSGEAIFGEYREHFAKYYKDNKLTPTQQSNMDQEYFLDICKNQYKVPVATVSDVMESIQDALMHRDKNALKFIPKTSGLRHAVAKLLESGTIVSSELFDQKVEVKHGKGEAETIQDLGEEAVTAVPVTVDYLSQNSVVGIDEVEVVDNSPSVEKQSNSLDDVKDNGQLPEKSSEHDEFSELRLMGISASELVDIEVGSEDFAKLPTELQELVKNFVRFDELEKEYEELITFLSSSEANIDKTTEMQTFSSECESFLLENSSTIELLHKMFGSLKSGNLANFAQDFETFSFKASAIRRLIDNYHSQSDIIASKIQQIESSLSNKYHQLQETNSPDKTKKLSIRDIQILSENLNQFNSAAELISKYTNDSRSIRQRLIEITQTGQKINNQKSDQFYYPNQAIRNIMIELQSKISAFTTSVADKKAQPHEVSLIIEDLERINRYLVQVKIPE